MHNNTSFHIKKTYPCSVEKFSNLPTSQRIIYLLYCLLIIAILGFGLFLRLKQYFVASPIWLDEMTILSNISKHPFFHIFCPPVYYQIAPPIWQGLNKIIFYIGDNTNVLIIRLLSIIMGCSSLFLFFQVLNKTFRSKLPILAGLFLFSINGPLVYYCAEFKPYICDVFITLLLILIYNNIDFYSLKKYLLWLFIFFILPFCSFPSLITCGAILILKIINIINDNQYNLKQKKENIYKIFSFGICLLLSAFIIYKMNHNTIAVMEEYWTDSFLQLSYDSFKTAILSVFNYLEISGNFILIFFFTGIVFSLFNKNNTVKLFLFIILLTFIAALLKLYPLSSRLSLFIMPIFIIIIVSVLDINYNNLKLNKVSALISLFLMYILFTSFPLIDNIKAVLDKNYTAIYEPVNVRQDETDEILYFLSLYKNGEKIISDWITINMAYYYNESLKYNHPIEYICNENLNFEEEFIRNPQNSYWIFGFLNNESLKNKDIRENIQNIIEKTGRKYKIYKINNEKIYYIEKQK